MDQDYLERLVTHEEIKEAFWDCGSSKAPGPDGFFFAFVKKYWDIIKKDLHDFINSFFTSCDMPYGANSSFFTLILPMLTILLSSTKFSFYYRSFDIHYKIIAKILANRLSKMIDKIVSKEQSTFISGFWGFGLKWRSWIKTCLSSSRASILVNGSPTSEFSINRGLRQGDPLSPFLFILVMEGLHNAFADAVDDVIITTGWNARDLKNIIRVLHVFYLASGLKIHAPKEKKHKLFIISTSRQFDFILDGLAEVPSNDRVFGQWLNALFQKAAFLSHFLLRGLFGVSSKITSE
ncbi:RNA-directed DNA polymerase, eukaryota [Tanacetum coccineum]